MYKIHFEVKERKPKYIKFSVYERAPQHISFQAAKKEPVRLIVTKNLKLDFITE